MFELITQIIILVAIFFLLRFVFSSVIGKDNRAWFGGFVLIVLLLLAFLEPNDRTIISLWSVLSFPLRPLGLSLLLLGFSVRQGAKKVVGQQALAAFLILLIASLPLTAYLLTVQADRQLYAEQIATQPVEAIVVLSDGITPNDPAYRIRTQVSSVADGLSASQRSRILFGVEQYQQQQSSFGRSPILLVSIPTGDNGTQAQNVDALLAGTGVRYQTIQGDDPRRAAEEAARQLGSTFEQGGRVPIIVVSPSISSRRVKSTFEQLNFNVVPRPTDFFVFQIQRGLRLAAISDLVPSAEALTITTRVIDEYLTTIYYLLRGWLANPFGL